jgi:imidazolonepropionase
MPGRADLIIHSASQLLMLTPEPQRGMELGELGLLEEGALLIGEGKILAVGHTHELRDAAGPKQEINASGKVVMPGFVDPHTHAMWAGDRCAEFAMRLRGASYMEILTAGGGILSTVRHTRAAGPLHLAAETRPRLDTMLAHGTTTAEVKTGYGLQTEAELGMLQALLSLDEEGPMEVVPTFLGAHAIPPEYAGAADKYVDLLCDEMLPAILEWWTSNAPPRPLPFVDVFCEEGAFTLQQSARILERAKALGFPLKIHADEFKALGGTRLAVRLGAASADHLLHTPQDEIEALGSSDTVAVALPCTPFGLGEDTYPNAQAILEAGGILALASDLNPGTAWCESMQFALALACRFMRLSPAQAIAAATINAAAALGRSASIGSLHPGKQADVLLLDIPDYRHLGYRFGSNLVSMVIKKGRVVARPAEGRRVFP